MRIAPFHPRFPAPLAFVAGVAVFLAGLGAPVSAADRTATTFDWQTIPGGRRAVLRVASDGRTGFTSLDAARTGIGFTNRLDDRLVMGNNNFMQGSGVALGDFDGDGWCDLYFCAIDGTDALYRNRGDWHFEDVTARAGVGASGWHSTGAVFADLDGDGRLDLLVNTLGKGTHAFLNLGNGRFRDATTASGLESRTGALGLALGDVDGDGDLDLYVANYGTQAILRGGGQADVKRVNGEWVVAGPHADRLRFVDGRLEEVGEPDVLYRNDGQGRFTPVPWNSEWFLDYDGKPMPAPWDFGLSVQIRDLNEDGFPDVYVCNDFQTVDRVWLNDGKGHFRLLSKLAMRQQSFAAMGVDFADIDRDGHLDFFVVEMLARSPVQRQRQVSGFTPAFPVPGRFEGRPEANRNTLFHGRGDGTFAEISNLAGVSATDWSWQPVFVDLDLDGFEDLLVVNGNAFDVQDRDATLAIQNAGPRTPEQARTHILRYPRWLSPNVAFRNRGDLTFEETSTSWGFDSKRISHGIALADLDHDGDLDAVVNCLYDAPLLLRNTGAGARVGVRLRGRAPNIQGIGAKVRLHGGAVPVQSQELVSGGRYLSGDDPMRVFAAGKSTNGMRLEVTWPRGAVSRVSNVLANAFYELEEPPATNPPPRLPTKPGSTWFSDVSEQLGHGHHEEIFDDYSRQPLLHRQLSSAGPGVAWVDLDGDEHDDLVIGSGRGSRLAVFRGDGKGGFKDLVPTNSPAVPDDLAGLAVASLPDGRPALFAAFSAYENTGLRTTLIGIEHNPDRDEIAVTPVRGIAPLKAATGPIALADLDGDGDLDLFVGARCLPGAYPRPATSRLYRQQAGAWVPDAVNQPLLDDLGLVNGAVWTDLDGDGFPELVLACEWGPVRIFRNARGRLSPWNIPLSVAAAEGTPARNSTLETLTGWWTGVSAGDLDGDGRMDLVVGNWGWNDVQHPTESLPVRLFHGDFGGRGTVDLLETVFAPELGQLLPRRSLAVLSQAAPKLAALYPTHAAFSTSTVPDLFRALEIQPTEVRAVTLTSMAFLNRGDRFEAVPLPREAQMAPVFGTVIADFDGDGIEDVFLAQNFFAFRPELPRIDAGRGLLLRGLGGGALAAVPGQESGLVVHGEQRGAAAADFDEDGRTDLVVTQNGAATRLFRNTRGPRGLRLRVHGPEGNPSGIGAVVRLWKGTKGTGPAREIHAGSGYWSQDSTTTVLSLSGPTDALSVTWPGGRKVRFELPPGVRVLTIDHRSTGTP